MPRKTDHKDGSMEVRGKFAPELLRWVTSGEQEITQEVNGILDKVMLDRRRRVEVFLTALARKYVERAVYFISRLPEIEGELLDPERIKTMRNADLIHLLGVVAGQVKDSSEFLRNFVSEDVLRSEPVPSRGAEFSPPPKEVTAEAMVSDDERDAAAAMPAESRQRIGSIMRRVLSAIDTAESNAGAVALRLPVVARSVDGDVQEDEKKKGGGK